MKTSNGIHRQFNGRLLRTLRKKKGWTQFTLGHELGGLHASLISKWEKYREEPNEYRREQLSTIWPDADFDEALEEGEAASRRPEGAPMTIGRAHPRSIGDELEAVRGVVYPQQVSWGPANGLPAGVQVWSAQTQFSVEETFVPWEEWRAEISRILLPWILENPAGYRFVTKEYRGKPDWIVWLIDPSNNWYCDAWFGGDPDRNWDFDGLIRLGDANSQPRSWITFQRYSDGTYRKLRSLAETIDEIKRSRTGN